MSATTNHYQIQSDTKSTTIQLQPDIGSAAWGDIEQVGTELLTSVNERNSSAWLIDLSRLEYMGSALVALLVRIWKAVQAGGGKVVVVCGDGMPREVIKLAGLDKVWTISDTTADAYKTLGVRAPAEQSDGTASVSGATQPASEFPILGVLSIVAALAAGGVLAIVLAQAEIDRNLAQLGIFGGAGIAVAFGLLSLFKESSWGRGLGFIALLAGIGVGTMGYMKQSEVVAAPPAEDREDEGSATPLAEEPEDEPEEATTAPGEIESADDDGSEETATDEAAATSEEDSEVTPVEETEAAAEDASASDQPDTDGTDTEEPDAE